jgi:iron(III) transport system permease protein
MSAPPSLTSSLELPLEAGANRATWWLRTGKLLRPRWVEIVSSTAVLFVLGVLVLYPLGWLIRLSVADRTRQVEVTLSAFEEVYLSPELYSVLLNTLVVCVGTTLLALALGVPLAWLAERSDAPLASRLTMLTLLPFVTSPYIGAIAWGLLAAPRSGFLNHLVRQVIGSSAQTGPFDIYSQFGMIWVMGLFSVPYVYLFAGAALRSIDPSLEEAGLVSGSNWRRMLRRVTLPLVFPALFSGALITFVLAISQFGVPQVLGVPARSYVLSTLIYRQMKVYPVNEPAAAALSFLVVAICFLALYIHGAVTGRQRHTTITGKGLKPRKVRLRGAWRLAATTFIAVYLTVVVVAPYVVLVYGSVVQFWTTRPTLDMFTLRNYQFMLFEYRATYTAIANSLILSIGAATACAVLALVAAQIVVRGRSRFRHVIEHVIMLPLGIPGTVLAVGLLAAWIRPPLVLYGTTWLLLVGYIAHFVPLSFRGSKSSLLQLHPELEESARVSGSTWLRSLVRIVAPLTAPGITAGWIILFVTSIRELSTSVLLYTPTNEVLAVLVFDMWESGRYPEVAVLSIISVLVAVVVLWLAIRLGRLRFQEVGAE